MRQKLNLIYYIMMTADVSPDSAMQVTFFAVAIGILLLAAIVIAVILYYKNREIRRKNRVLAQQITQLSEKLLMHQASQNAERRVKSERLRERQRIDDGTSEMGTSAGMEFAAATGKKDPVSLDSLDDEQLFNYLDEIIVREQLYLDPKFGRQALIDRFLLSKDRLGAAFSRGSEHAKLTDYIQNLRLERAAQQLVKHTDKSIVQIANDCGFSTHRYFCDRFKLYYGMTPSEFREQQ